MSELLFEIGCEELPALAIEPAMSFMESFLAQGLNEHRLSFSQIRAYGTPRRLVLGVEGLALVQEELREEVLGPSLSLAYDKGQQLTKAALGFIKARDLDESKIYVKQTSKGDVIAGQRVFKGKEASEILPDLLVQMMQKIPFPKRMRWDNSGESFARPVRWLLSLLDGKHLLVSFADVKSGIFTQGHRFMSPSAFSVTSLSHYLQEIRSRFVILDPHEREALFVEAARDKLKKLDAYMRIDVDLLAVVRNLFEYPFAIIGSFEKEYLNIPRDILICEMKAHQKCFSVHDKNGELLPYFVCSAGTKPRDEDFFARGNARVLRARFEDGAFYFREDRKKTLREHAPGLAGLIFERDLGTVADKSVRLERVALAMADKLNLTPEEKNLIEAAAPILKADLVTGVVQEFPELQGIMGHVYASMDGEGDEIAEILESHYRPRFADDELPTSRIAAIFSVADRIDTLVGIIGIGKKPAGNKDPFALRRAAIALTRIFIQFGMSIDIDDLIDWSIESYGKRFLRNEVSIDVKDFIIQRARGVLIDDLAKEQKEMAVSFADSVLAISAQNLFDTFARAHALLSMHHRDPDGFATLIQTFKRASNIVKKAGLQLSLDADLAKRLSTPAEIDLLQDLDVAKRLVIRDMRASSGLIDQVSSYCEIFSHVARLKPKLDTFFDKVMVMADDLDLRYARLALLTEIKGIADRIADFTHL